MNELEIILFKYVSNGIDLIVTDLNESIITLPESQLEVAYNKYVKIKELVEHIAERIYNNRSVNALEINRLVELSKPVLDKETVELVINTTLEYYDDSDNVIEVSLLKQDYDNDDVDIILTESVTQEANLPF